MKTYRILSLFLAGVSALSLPALAATSQTKYKFAETSPLETGRWVKISVDENGIYEISYDKLRDMGFSDPSKVSVFGANGALADWNFLSSDGSTRMIEDNLEAVPVRHSENKLFFYGEGPEKILCGRTGFGSGMRFRHYRQNKNIYSKSNYYMLTDSEPVTEVASRTVDDKTSATTVNYGYAYKYHEKDLYQGFYKVGQIFWGEQMVSGDVLEYNLEAPYCYDKPAYIMVDYAAIASQPGSFDCKFNDATVSTELSKSKSKLYQLENNDANAVFNIDQNNFGTAKLSFSLTGSYSIYKPFAIDYWTVTYPISLEYVTQDKNFTSQYIAVEPGYGDCWRHAVPADCEVWDVTKGKAPESLPVDGGYFYNTTNETSSMIAFNPKRTQKQINSEWSEVKNQNLHGLQNQDIEFLICSSETFRSYAERIAALHEKYDGIKTAVVTPEEIYNEFNHGTPEAASIRALIKMLYQSQGKKLKTVLFLGPIFKDLRNVSGNQNRTMDGMPAYMQPITEFDKPSGAAGACAMDYFGCTDDYMNSTGSTKNISVKVGIGLIPIESKEEAETAIKKIKAHLECQDYSNIANEMMTMSGTGDEHVHDFQAFRLSEIYQNYARTNMGTELASSPLWTEGLGKKVKNEFINSLNNGKLMTTYYGHAGLGDFSNIVMQDFMNLKNQEPGFLFIAACDLCVPDNQTHGIGDVGVLHNTKGFAGSICSTRNVLSHENQALSENVAKAIFYDANKNFRTSTPTFGEIYAQAKDWTVNDSQMAYVLIGDPALSFPIALGKMTAETDRTDYRGGEVMEVSGKILNSNGKHDTGYNGYVTVKVMEPKRTTAIVADPEENGIIFPNPRLIINDHRLVTVKTEVKNGEYKARVPLPAKVDKFLSTPDSVSTLNVLVSAYNPETRFATAGSVAVVMPLAGSEPSVSAIFDDKAPSVAVEYDDLLCKLTVSASDETALMPGIGNGKAVTLTIGDKTYTADAGVSTGVSTTNFVTAISTASLPVGTYTVKAQAKDVAGNVSEVLSKTIEIKTYAPLKLTAADDLVIDTLQLGLDRGYDGELTLIVIDKNGKTVYTDEFTGTSADYDFSDLAPGNYRVSVRDDSPRGNRIFSNWIEFTKID